MGLGGGGGDGFDSDSSSGVDVETLICTVCSSGEASNETDILMCDGFGCRRAYHTSCVYPEVKGDLLGEEEDDWFCPYCEMRAELIYEVNIMFWPGGGESPRRACQSPRLVKIGSAPSPKDDQGNSLVWDDPTDIFDNAEEEYKEAVKCEKEGFDAELVARYVGRGGNSRFFEGGSDSESESER